MKRSWRFAIYGVIGAGILLAALAAPAAWATPGQDESFQSVPTRTPTPPVLPPTEPPPDTPVPPTSSPATAAPQATPGKGPDSGAAVAGCPGPAALTLTADQRAVWPGATVVFTATLTNTTRQELKQIVLVNQLAAGLEPVAVLSSAGSWTDRALSVTAPTLAPGARLQVVYSARVGADPGQAIAARASADVSGCPQRTASLTLGLPPALLPATGGSLN